MRGHFFCPKRRQTPRIEAEKSRRACPPTSRLTSSAIDHAVRRRRIFTPTPISPIELRETHPPFARHEKPGKPERDGFLAERERLEAVLFQRLQSARRQGEASSQSSSRYRVQLVVSSPDFTLPQPKTQSSLTFGFTRFFPFFREDGAPCAPCSRAAPCLPETTKDGKVSGRWVLYLEGYKPKDKNIKCLWRTLIGMLGEQELGPR